MVCMESCSNHVRFLCNVIVRKNFRSFKCFNDCVCTRMVLTALL